MNDDLLIDLAAHSAGGRVLEASDEFFGDKEQLVADGSPQPRSRPEAIDGWATRRRRGSGHDWAIVRLGVPGLVHAVVIDTSHITGSHPAACSIEAAAMPGNPNIVDLVRSRDRWQELVARSPLPPDTRTRFAASPPVPVTHLRLVLYPDGGVARLRCLGDPIPGEGTIDGERAIDLAAVRAGGRVIACSDTHFGSPNTMLTSPDPAGPGDGWLTRRRRDPGADWAIIRLAGPAVLHRLEIDTSGFVGNAPAACTVDASTVPPGGATAESPMWRSLLPVSPLEPDRRHTFEDLAEHDGVTHLRLTIHPDGGIARLRAIGIAARPWMTIAQAGG